MPRQLAVTVRTPAVDDLRLGHTRTRRPFDFRAHQPASVKLAGDDAWALGEAVAGPKMQSVAVSHKPCAAAGRADANLSIVA